MKKGLSIFLLTMLPVVLTAQRFGKTLKESPGIVSYTYRHSFQKDVAATLDTIRQLGISNIEFSNLFGRTASEIKNLLNERGMRCTSFGVSYDDLVKNTAEVGRNAKTLGARFVRVAWVPHEGPFTIELARKTVEDFNAAGRKLKDDFGLIFCYHNHGYEFAPYKAGTFFDYIVANTDPEAVSFELDILWAFHGGADPVELLNEFGPRFRLMHVKDRRKGVVGDFTGSTSVENDVALGTGQINVMQIIMASRKSGIRYYYIEDESSSVNKQVPESLHFVKSL